MQQLRDQIASVDSGLVVIYGPGAALIAEGDVLVYADMARWEIQQRFRRGELGNWGVTNVDEDVLRRYKRAFLWNGGCSIAIKPRCCSVLTWCWTPTRQVSPRP